MLLKKNRVSFETLMTHVISPLHSEDINIVIMSAKLAAASAWLAFPGFFVSPELEKVLHRFSSKLPQKIGLSSFELPAAIQDSKRVLHVLSTAYEIGGHTRLVERWINNRLEGERHSVIITNQNEFEMRKDIPYWLIEAARKAGGACIQMDDHLSMMQKAWLLRDVSNKYADLVVLHIHPDDPVPSIAFGAPGGPPVVLLNHADHVFWMGAGISDVVIDVRESANSLSIARRSPRQTGILPLPLKEKNEISKDKSREKFGISKEHVVLLSIATPEKYRPINENSFIDNAVKILNKNQNAILLVVGPNSNDPLWQSAINNTGGRLTLCGLQNDLTPFYSASDIYLESYPFGSFTAALDACLYGLPVVKAPSPCSPLLTVKTYKGMMENTSCTDSYINEVNLLIKDVELRLHYGNQQKQDVLDQHTGEGWKERLKNIMKQIPEKHHVGFGDNLSGESFVYEYDMILANMLNQQERESVLQMYLRYFLPKIM